MLSIEKLNIGIVGIGGRPRSFLHAIEECKFARLAAVCDLNTTKMDTVVDGIMDVSKFTDYYEMLEKGELDAVVIGTPMYLHTPQSVRALEQNIHVFSEVTAAITIEQCKKLVNAVKCSKAEYMMGENCNYMKPYMLVKELIRAGLFGDIYYAEGEYLHNCRDLAEVTLWRKEHLYEVNGITYGTHSLGPILSWFEGDRIIKVSCSGSGHHYNDKYGKPYSQEDTCVMLAKTEMGKLIKIRLDIESNRPYNLKYLLQGTNGCYDSSRFRDEKDKLWIKGIHSEAVHLETMEDMYLPEIWRKNIVEIEKGGHGGSDYLIMKDFLDAIFNGKPMPIGIHEAMDMTLPGLISQESIIQDGIWMEVPNSREW